MQAPMAIRQITVSGSCSTALKRSTLLFCDFDAVCRLASACGELAPDHDQHRRPRAGDRSLARHLGVNVVCGVSRISTGYQGRLAVHDRTACRPVSDGAFPGTGDDPGKVVWLLDLRRFNTKEGSHDGRQNHDPERTQSEFPGHPGAAHLWLDDAQGN